jgi:hypothetical protein
MWHMSAHDTTAVNCLVMICVGLGVGAAPFGLERCGYSGWSTRNKLANALTELRSNERHFNSRTLEDQRDAAPKNNGRSNSI